MRSPTQQEEARLRSLVDYRLLDSGAESDFDQLVQLALKMGQVPMALISLVDRDRQWLKARVGVETAQGERSAYFANEILKKAEPLVLENIEPADGLGLRFFAGFPLINAEGFTLGFLAVMDRQPHKLTPDQVQSLKVLADQAVQLMELRKANVRVLESARILSKYTQIIEDQQETLIQTAKMSSLGSMAAGIAHEINTPLAAIKSRAEVMLEELEMGGSDPIDLPGSLTKIIQMVDRVASIITGLRMFSRNSTTDPKASCKIQDLVKDTIELCGDRLKSRGIELRLAIEEGIEVDCRAAEISQVLLNLISNASDAVENRTEKWVQIEVKRHPDSVQISVTDSGPGIDPKITEKLMDPFFTTKEVGKGTGLGLSISKGLVEAHGGRFYLDKNFSRTRFIIELPAIPSHTEIKKEAA